jgi:hypothetical protein
MKLSAGSVTRIVKWSALVLVTVSVSANALSWNYNARGYLKNTVTGSKPGDELEMLDVTRGRLKFRWFPTYSVTVAADYEASFYLALPERANGFQAFQNAPLARGELYDLEWRIYDKDNIYSTHTVDRLYAEYYAEGIVLTVGRQRVAWGVSDYFRPLDRFAPFAPAAIDKSERAGIDAVRVSLPRGRLSNLEFVYQPGHRFDSPRFGGQVRTNFSEWDVGIVGFVEERESRDNRGKMVGGSLSGPMFGAGVKGEFLYAWDDRVGTNHMHLDDLRFGSELRNTHGEPAIHTSYARATLGASYGFEWRNLVVSSEAYYDGTGATNPWYYDTDALWMGDRLTLARYYAAGSASLLATPLVALNAAAIVNAADGSWLLNPSVTWDPITDFQIIAGAQIFYGNDHEEYASQPNSLYAILSWHF